MLHPKKSSELRSEVPSGLAIGGQSGGERSDMGQSFVLPMHGGYEAGWEREDLPGQALSRVSG